MPRNDSARKSDNSFILQGSILAIASIISRIIGLVYRIPLTNIIGKTGNDYYGTAFEIYNIILIISSYSLPLAVSKIVAARIAKGELKNVMRVFRGALVFAVTTGTIAMLVVWFFADFFTGTLLKTPYSVLALKVLAPVLLIVAVAGVFRGFFQGLNTMTPTAISQIAEQITNAIVSVVAAYSLFSYGKKAGKILNDDHLASAYGAAGGTLGTGCGALVALIFMIVVFSIFYSRFKDRVERDHYKNYESYFEITKILFFTIVPVLLSTTIYNISSIIDQTIFKNIVTVQGYKANTISEWWGVYTGQFKVLINVPISIASAMASSAVPSLTAAFHAGDMKKVRRQINSATRFIMLIAFPCTVGLIVLGGPIMMMLFSDADPVSAQMMKVGGISVLFFSLSTLSNGLLQGIDKLRIPVKNAAIALVAQAFFLVFLLYAFKLNIYAVIVANAFYALLMCILNGIAIHKYSGVHENIMRIYIIPGISSVFMGVFVYLIYFVFHAVTKSNLISTIIAILLGMVFYFFVLVFLKGISARDIERIPGGHGIVLRLKKIGIL